jgi:general secretion pathway protein F
MPVYAYTALDAGGRTKEGGIEAGSVTAARQKLRDDGIFPVEIAESSESRNNHTEAGKGGGGLFKRVGLQELSVMTRQLATLIGAGLPLVPSLSALAPQIRNQFLRATVVRIREEVNEGNSFTGALSHFPAIFPPFYINMARAGEASGTLNLVLERLADFQEKQQEMRSKIRTALAYPIFMFVVGSGVLLFLVTFVVPNITNIFSEMRQTLPAITVFLIVVSGFLKSFWWILALVLGVGIVGVRSAIKKTEGGRNFWDKLKLTFPLFGTLNRKIAVARFARTLGTLLQSSVPLLTALEIARNVVDNRLVANEIKQVGKDVEEGQSLSAPLSRNRFFPPIAVEMIAVGEQSGNVEKMLFKVADAYEKEVESNIVMITSLLEPAMILVMGGVVGFIVVSILLPIFEMNQLVR